MKAAIIFGLSLAAIAAPAGAQTAPATPAATPSPGDPASALTEKEQATMKRCQAMTPPQQAQSSKCSAVMKKAGMADPAAARAPAVSPTS